MKVKVRELMAVNKENPKTNMFYQNVVEVNEVLTDDGLEAWELVLYFTTATETPTATFTKQDWNLFERAWHKVAWKGDIK